MNEVDAEPDRATPRRRWWRREGGFEGVRAVFGFDAWWRREGGALGIDAETGDFSQP